MPDPEIREPVESMRKMFAPPPATLEAFEQGAARFWHFQDRMLDAMQAFADGWVKRRHDGAQAAAVSAQRLCRAQSPLEFIKEQQEWFAGAAQRLSADGAEYQKQWTEVASFMFKPLDGAAQPDEASPPSVAPSKRARAEAA